MEENKIIKKIVIVAGAVLILVAVAFALVSKGVFVAATVNGSPISRLSVINLLEDQAGSQTLDSLINKKLIDNELDQKGIFASEEEIENEVAKIKIQFEKQGGTLEEALSMQNISNEKFRKEIENKIKLEKLLADKLTVTDDEVNAIIAENPSLISAGMNEDETKIMIKDQLMDQKLQQVVEKFISELKANAKIKYYTNYKGQ